MDRDDPPHRLSLRRRAGGDGSRPRCRPPDQAPPKPSLAVLPFANIGNDPEQEVFADGLAEDIITSLSKLSGLLVIARNSCFAYKGRSVDIRQVAKELAVRYVLEGSVRKSGNRIRVTVQLNDAESGGHVWADGYDRELAKSSAVQDDVTRQIVNALNIKLGPTEAALLAESGTNNVEALVCFRQCAWRWSAQTLIPRFGNGRTRSSAVRSKSTPPTRSPMPALA